MWVHPFEVGENDVSGERVMMLEKGMLDDFVGHDVLVFAAEVISTARHVWLYVTRDLQWGR